jgi:hypothetical protein
VVISLSQAVCSDDIVRLLSEAVEGMDGGVVTSNAKGMVHVRYVVSANHSYEFYKFGGQFKKKEKKRRKKHELSTHDTCNLR